MSHSVEQNVNRGVSNIACLSDKLDKNCTLKVRLCHYYYKVALVDSGAQVYFNKGVREFAKV